MSPPRKSSGFTTKESVVMASRSPFKDTTAWSSRRFNTELPSAGRNTSFSRSPLSLPPLPWPSRIRSRAGRGSGQENAARSFVSLWLTISECNEVAAVLIVGGTSTFRRNHRRAERLIGSAANPERGAIGGFLMAQKHFGTDAFAGLLRANLGEIENALGIIRSVLFF